MAVDWEMVGLAVTAKEAVDWDEAALEVVKGAWVAVAAGAWVGASLARTIRRRALHSH